MTTVGAIAAPSPRSIAIGPFGSRMKADNYVESGVPVVRGTNITKTRSPTGDFVFIAEEFADSMPGCILTAGDLVFPHRGAIGEVGLIEGDVKMMLSTSLMKLTPDVSVMDPTFVYYYFKSNIGRRELLMRSSTVGTPGIGQPLSSLRSIPIPVPAMEEQRAIAATLGALDDKIESNHRVQTHSSALIDALSERIRSANATRQVPLGELVDFNQLTLRPGDENSEVLYVDIASVSPGRIGDMNLTTWGEAPSRARRGVRDGDIVFSTVRPGRRSFAQVLDPDERMVVSTGFAVMSPNKSIGSSLLTTVAASEEFAAYLESVAHGSAYPAVNVAAMANFPVEIPEDVAVVASFEAATMPLRRRAHAAEQENNMLAKLRDTLLPELLTGHVRVPEAVAAIDDAL